MHCLANVANLHSMTKYQADAYRPTGPPAALRGSFLQLELRFCGQLRISLPPFSCCPPPVVLNKAETGVLSSSHSVSEANLGGRCRLECDKSICPGLNLYANLK